MQGYLFRYATTFVSANPLNHSKMARPLFGLFFLKNLIFFFRAELISTPWTMHQIRFILQPVPSPLSSGWPRWLKPRLSHHHLWTTTLIPHPKASLDFQRVSSTMATTRTRILKWFTSELCETIRGTSDVLFKRDTALSWFSYCPPWCPLRSLKQDWSLNTKQSPLDFAY